MVFNKKLYLFIFLLLINNLPLLAQIKRDVKPTATSSVLKGKSEIYANTNNLLNERIHLIERSFIISGANQSIKMWVYLPKNYSESKKRYPVIYTPEGHDVFNQKNKKNQWQVNSMLDSLEISGNRTAIVVAIDADLSDSTNHFSYFINKDSVRLWENLADFIVDSIKPFIDKHYSTLSDRTNTLIMGASLAANFTYYTFLNRNQTFGKAALFSPKFEISPELNYFTDSLAANVSGKLFYYSGERETALSQESADNIILKLAEKSSAVIYSLSDSEGIMNVEYWRKYFSSFIIWALADGNNSIINVKN